MELKWPGTSAKLFKFRCLNATRDGRAAMVVCVDGGELVVDWQIAVAVAGSEVPGRKTGLRGKFVIKAAVHRSVI